METSLNSSLTGQSFPIGPTLGREGANFCLFSKNADRVELLLFDNVDDIAPKRVIAMDPAVNRTYHYWHVFLPSLKSGQLYGYRVTGPNDPSRGHRFDPDKILLDPYAKAVAIPKKFSRGSFCSKGQGNCSFIKKCAVQSGGLRLGKRSATLPCICANGYL
jgi:glycogen operon protein